MSERAVPYEDEVRERWGDTSAYRESARRTAGYSSQTWTRIHADRESIEAAFAAVCREGVRPDSAEALAIAERHRLHIDTWFYPCPTSMHQQLGELYVADERFARHYDERCPGLAEYVRAAIAANARASD